MLKIMIEIIMVMINIMTKIKIVTGRCNEKDNDEGKFYNNDHKDKAHNNR
jgi:hypothetical protein